MINKIFLICALLIPARAWCQTDSIVVPESQTLDLQFLIAEALMNNPDIHAALYQMDVMDAKIPQARSLDYPELSYMSEEMPGFDYNRAMYHRLELMQMFRFPSKLSTQGKIAGIESEHAHHDHLEKLNEVVAKLKMAYYELWFVQQSIVLNQENMRLLKQFAQSARTRYGTGQVSQQDVLKAQVELAMAQNESTSLRQQELSAKAMLMAILNREPKDTLGFAVIGEEVSFTAQLDSLELRALQSRPMLIHDSLNVEENRTMLTLAKQEYIPDLKLGLEYVTSPIDGFNGWSVRAVITLPFAPWTLAKSNGRVDEASASIRRASTTFSASRNMVLASVRDLFFKAQSYKQQLDAYRREIIPQVDQSVRASIAGYQTGTTDFLMLIDAYRTRVATTREYFMSRMKFEQTVADLEKEVGTQELSTER